jgi:hypothetical protein
MTNKEFIKKLQGENKRLQDKHEKATLKIKLMKDELLESQNYTNELENNNLVYMSHNLALMVENTELKQEIECHEDVNTKIAKDVAELTEEKENLEIDYIEVKNKNQDLVIENTHLNANIKNLKENVNLLIIENKDFREALDFYKKKSKNKNKSIIQENAELKKKLENIQTYLNNTCTLNG